MATLLLFHHALGLTEGMSAFADTLRDAGHRVATPDLFDGRVFSDLDEGVAYAEGLDRDEVAALAATALVDLGTPAVVGGFSFGSMSAQRLAQTRQDVLGAILYHGGVDPSWFGSPWPAALPLQLHEAEGDPWAEPDEKAALIAAAPLAESFVYPGAGHLLADSSSPDHDPESARLITERTLAFLERVG